MPPLIVAVIGAVSAALFHALPIRVNDNLTIPIGSALTMWIIGLAL
jgi:dolichol kinase